jgi:hypothetical protein
MSRGRSVVWAMRDVLQEKALIKMRTARIYLVHVSRLREGKLLTS